MFYAIRSQALYADTALASATLEMSHVLGAFPGCEFQGFCPGLQDLYLRGALGRPCCESRIQVAMSLVAYLAKGLLGRKVLVSDVSLSLVSLRNPGTGPAAGTA